MAAVFTVLGVACSKTNEVDQSTTLAVGQQCGRPDDPGCGEGAVCALGFCRHGCTTDAECAQGAICVGDMPPFGCSLPAEIACSSSQPCESEGLSCGIDGVCRLPCQEDGDCSRNEHHCIAGSCVGDGERDFATWDGCGETGDVQCVGASFQHCNVTGPGWVEAKSCGENTCSEPEGRCLELVVEVSAELAHLTVVGDALYWLDGAGDLYTSSIEPNSASSLAMELPDTAANGDRRLNGPLLGIVGLEGGSIFARMVRVDGTELMNVDTGLDTSNPDRNPSQVMPTTAGLFWIERRAGGTFTEGMPVLVHLPTDAEPVTTPTELGPVAGTGLVPAFCTVDERLYFVADGDLYRAAVDGAIEGPLAAGTDVACSENQAFVISAGGISRIAADGTAAPVVEYAFSAGQAEKGMARMMLFGDEVLATAPSAVVAANVVTGEVRVIVEDDNGGNFSGLYTADEEHLFVGWQDMATPGGAPQRIMRTAWTD